MNPKQLANILVRILGLSLCAGSVPGILTGILYLIQSFIQLWSPLKAQSFVFGSYLGGVQLVSSLALLFVGVWILAKSRWIVTRWIAKDEG